MLHLHFNRDLVGVMGIFAKITAGPVSQFRSTADVRYLTNGSEDVAVEFEDLLPEQELQ